MASRIFNCSSVYLFACVVSSNFTFASNNRANFSSKFSEAFSSAFGTAEDSSCCHRSSISVQCLLTSVFYEKEHMRAHTTFKFECKIYVFEINFYKACALLLKIAHPLNQDRIHLKSKKVKRPYEIRGDIIIVNMNNNNILL